MVNLKNVGAVQAESYYRVDDYYSRDNPPARWVGQGAAKLGLTEETAAKDFAELLRGKLPDGTQIAAGAGGKRRAGTDLTISAPKSVSIAAALAKDSNTREAILDAHREAVSEALAEIENRIEARTTQDGVTRTESTGVLVCRSVDHDTSRLGDMNVHTHNVILNVTQRADGQWVAIENNAMYRAQKELDTLYKSDLACRMAALGFSLRATKHGFELRDITDAQIREFSRRTADIDRKLEEQGLSREGSSAAQRERANLSTRDRSQHFDRKALVKDWKERAEALGLEIPTPTKALVGLANTNAAREAVDFARAHLSEREMAWTEQAVETAAMAVAWGSARASDIKKELAGAIERKDFIRKADGSLTTVAGQRLETSILDIERQGRGAVSPVAESLAPGRIAESLEASGLNPKQREAMEFLLNSTSQVTGLQGAAGVGKTTALRKFVKLAIEAGFQVQGLAPSLSAVKALTGAGVEAQTLQSWEAVAGKVSDSRTIFLLDEASLASAQQVKNLLERSANAGSRVILTGDRKQYEAVDAGRAFPQLQDSGMATATIDKMLRQQTTELQKVAALAKEGKGHEALKVLSSVAAVHQISDREERHQAVAKRFASLDAEMQRDCLVLTGSNHDRKSLNAAIRKELGLAGKGKEVQIFERDDKTVAMRRRAVAYAPGQAIRWEKAYRSLGVKKGDFWKVRHVDGNEVVAERMDGRLARFRPTAISGKGITTGAFENRELGAGDRVRLTGNVPTLQQDDALYNGQKATVVSCDAGRLSLRVDGSSRVVDVDLTAQAALSLDHGFAATGHSAQGLGAHHVILERDSSSLTASAREFYTDVTRAKFDLDVFTDSVKGLGASIERQVEKTVALDVPSLPPLGNEPAIMRENFGLEM